MSELTRILISSLIKQRMQEPERLRQEQAREAEMARAREFQLVRDAVDSGANEAQLWKLQSLTPNIPPGEFEGYATLAGLRSKKAKEEQKVKELVDPQQLSQLASAATPTIGPTGNLVQPDPSTSTVGTDLAQRQVALAEADRADLIPTLLSNYGGQLAANTRTVTQARDTEKLKDLRTRQTEGRTDWRDKRKKFIADEATALAYFRQGFGQLDPSIDAITERFTRVGVPPGQAAAMALEAEHKSKGMAPIIAERTSSAQGTKEEVKDVEDVAAAYTDSYPQLADSPTLKRDVRLQLRGLAVFDLEAASIGMPSWQLAPSPGEAKRITAQIEGRLESRALLGMLDEAYKEHDTASKDPKRSGEVFGGPFKGATLFDILAVGGAGAPEVVRVRTLAGRYVLSEVRAAQGAKASDMDLSFVVLFVPAPYEYGTKLGDAKMAQLKEVRDMRTNLRRSPKERAEIEKINRRYSGATSRLRSLSDQAAREAEESTTGEASETTMKALAEEASRFQGSEAAKAMKRDLIDSGIVSEHGERTGSGVAEKYLAR